MSVLVNRGENVIVLLKSGVAHDLARDFGGAIVITLVEIGGANVITRKKSGVRT